MSQMGESFCPLSKSKSYAKVENVMCVSCPHQELDLGEWEFAADKTISNRCRSINQFQMFIGISGQMLIEDLMNGSYVVFPGQKFQLFTKPAQIEKLKSTVKITKYVMVRSNTFEVGNYTVDDIFSRSTRLTQAYLRITNFTFAIHSGPPKTEAKIRRLFIVSNLQKNPSVYT
ncbi:unnamed protein product [Rhizophagus irregularis]|uniref:Uncharacterized protein n=1 Tax=Rhizophagus irregularis TaxID=588596 RepID=A0A916E672_9GLOM|nr:unnamed protein product [Rhizophagus irregularis]CAB5362318.1 unnamed protein product [Rhizophagus irregularis]